MPIARVSSSALGIVVKADSPCKALGELAAEMRRKPGEITFSSGGAGSTSHLCAVMLNDLTRTRARHIPYKGNGPAVTDVIAGQVDFTCQGAPGVVPMIKAGHRATVEGILTGGLRKLSGRRAPESCSGSGPSGFRCRPATLPARAGRATP
ncbi:Tripartite tricarboxylate transporter family receptor [compost metagenome]